MSTDWADLPPFELGFPGELRDRLVAVVLSGAKTSTTGLVLDYEHEGEELPEPGDRAAMLDSAGQPVAVIECTGVRIVRLADVDLQHALDEGEGDETIESWRAGHERFWHSEEMREAMGDPLFSVDDDTLCVLQRFTVVDR